MMAADFVCGFVSYWGMGAIVTARFQKWWFLWIDSSGSVGRYYFRRGRQVSGTA
jgi:hypothetical protein